MAMISLSDIKNKSVDQDIQGVFRPTQTMKMPYTLGFTNKENGILSIGVISIRIYDNHDDGLYFLDHLLDQQQQDVNADGYMDLVLTGTAVMSGEKETDPVTTRPIRSVFLFDPATMSFTNSIPDAAVDVSRSEGN